MADEEDVETVLVRMSGPDKKHNEQALEALEEHLEAAGLGEVVGTVCLASEEVTLMLEVAPSFAGQAVPVVMPRVRALLEQLGFAEHATVELAQQVDDDEDWDDDEEEAAD